MRQQTTVSRQQNNSPASLDKKCRKRAYTSAVSCQLSVVVAVLLAISLLFIASPVFAALVPCGTSSTPPCKLCHLFVLIKNIIDFMVKLSFPLAGLMFAWGGIMLIFGGKVEVGTAINPKSALVAKRIMTGAVTGLLIVLVAWVLIDTILVALTGNSRPPGFPWPWYDIGCPT